MRFYLKTILVTIGVICAFALKPQAILAEEANQLLFDVLRDELDRNMKNLVMEDLERPYYLSYTIDDFQQLEVSATLGQLLDSRLQRGRYLTTDLRVGDWSLDNSNFVSGFSGFGPSYTSLPVDDDYDAIRNKIYLQTDRVYKDAVENLSKKRAYLQNRVINDRPADHLQFPPNTYIDQVEAFDIDPGFFEELARDMTSVFLDYPEIIESQLRVTASVVNQYLLNSTGTKTLVGDRIYGFQLSMQGRSEDGQELSNEDRIVAGELSQLPGRDQLIAWARENAEKMSAIIKGDTLEDYIGPVLFVDDAVGEFFRQLFAKHVSNMPSPLFESDRFGGSGSAFDNKLRRRVLPSSFNVYNDPTLGKFKDQPLIGSYAVDDVGVKARRTQLVKEGKLINFLIGDAPTKKMKESTASARGAVGGGISAKPANLIFESSEKSSLEHMKKSLLELAKDIDLDYGLVITRLRDLNSPTASFGGMGGRGGGEELTVPFEAYKLYADGRMVPVRGLQFNDVSVRIMRDILEVGDQPYLYNYLIGNDYELPATIIAPPILVEEMELKHAEQKVKKPPVLPSPLAGKN